MDECPSTDKLLNRDLRLLADFINIYCGHKHSDVTKVPVDIKTHDVAAIVGKDIQLCDGCTKLLTHAFVKRSTCPFDPKPACKHCTEHCYHPTYREQIKEVMKYSGRRLVMTGRLDYLFKLLF
ncbi:MAG: hypothetical protein DHS20C16_30660 [Phycisphaerae bacterium]|nr:MAG: hypothetical protein DHS20C16_30660 [Phycisphaerae bacterium]